MSQVCYETELQVPQKEIWKLFCDIPSYKKHVAFVQKVVAPKEFKEGMVWYDITTVLWIPLKVYHRITTIEDNYLRFDLSGVGIRSETEEIRLSLISSTVTKIIITITFDLGFILNLLLGKLVQKRLYIMCDKTAREFEAWYIAEKTKK